MHDLGHVDDVAGRRLDEALVAQLGRSPAQGSPQAQGLVLAEQVVVEVMLGDVYVDNVRSSSAASVPLMPGSAMSMKMRSAVRCEFMNSTAVDSTSTEKDVPFSVA